MFVGVVFPLHIQGGTLTTPRIRRHATKKPCVWVRRRVAGPEMRRYGEKVSRPKTLGEPPKANSQMYTWKIHWLVATQMCFGIFTPNYLGVS